MSAKVAIQLYQLPQSLDIKRATVLHLESILDDNDLPKDQYVFVRNLSDRLIQEVAVGRKQLGYYKQIISTYA